MPLLWFVYILRCSDSTLYTGIARDVRARLQAHESGRGARYTRGRGPLQLCATRRCQSQGDALRLEHAIKQLSRKAKEKLVQPRQLAAFARKLTKATSVGSRTETPG
jgi:putative endonuclease